MGRSVSLNYFTLRNLSFFVITILISQVITVPADISLNGPNLEISLDCTDINGKIFAYSEINCGPLPNHDIHKGVDLTKQYNQIGVELIRTHDFSGPTDISTIFPDFDANTSNELSYDFTKSDQYISSIINANSKVFYRLGESASANESLRTPPKNNSKWADVCKHIVMHYNDGWNDGFFYNISYWEIWNEPDLLGFWNGTAEEYYNLYHTTVETLKNYNSSLKIGGPCTSSLTNEKYTSNFLEYLNKNEISLDFFSWHQYPNTPYELYKSSTLIRNLLDNFGFINTENINTEWNINILTAQRDKDNAKNAAFTACSLTAFHDAGLDHAIRYRGTQDPNWLMRFLGLDLSLFRNDGVFKKPALSYLLMNCIADNTPNRLTTPEMDASNGYTYLAGISDDQSNISILISNFNAKNVDYNLNITNIPWNSEYDIVHYQINNKDDFKIIEKTTQNTSTINLSKTIKQSTIHYFRLTNSSTVPPEGPKTAKIPLWLKLRVLDPLSKILSVLLIVMIFG